MSFRKPAEIEEKEANERLNNSSKDYMGQPRQENISHYSGSFSFKTYQLNGANSIWTQTYSANAQAMAQYISSQLSSTDYGHLDRIIIAKNTSLHGISAYDFTKNELYISEELIDKDKFNELVDTDYFAAESLNDVLTHELLGHKKHWDSIKAFYSKHKNDYTDLFEAKIAFDRNLCEYIDKQRSNDYNYIKKTVSPNAFWSYENNSVNELVAEVSVLRSKGKITDKYLFDIVAGMIDI